ncbi:MAG: hypothetical protein ALECFALPRED_007915 [Alectoria fallacina]|uniref:Uncharacterized protein n=1 Tax=Alectoria fallacina TaxID=1903189 RepID=A0A8H3J1E3_9LECA|nr:MAG: hypothetical protein ALECFALPRED_007915 [Alectoria fallacina]
MFLTGSWFWRGFQSAIFYYISCAPCTKLAYRRKRRKQLKRERSEKALHEAEEGLHQHPSPFSTNPHWKEEIALGPGPPQRKANRDGKGRPKDGRGLRTGGVGTSTETGTSSADTVVGEEGGEKMGDSGEGWNKRRYQREDEILWGKEEEEGKPTGMSPVSRSASGKASYYQARNPAVNDLHPPVVSTQPTHRSETQWMLQPPPRAKIMEGKEKANSPNRSRSGSSASKDSKASGKKPESLGRQVGDRLMELKFQRGEHLSADPSSVPMTRASSARSTASSMNIAQGQPHDRDPQASLPPRSIEATNRKPPPPSPPPPLSIPSEPSLLSPMATRPPLSTIPSASLPQRHKGRPSHLRPLLISTDSASSLHVLQELVAPATQLNTIKAASTPIPDAAVSVKLPPVNHQEDAELRLPEVESWFPGSGWSFPSKSAPELRQRWSMDL